MEISVLILICFKKKLFWWKLSNSIICVYRNMTQEIALLLYFFSKTIVVGFPYSYDMSSLRFLTNFYRISYTVHLLELTSDKIFRKKYIIHNTFIPLLHQFILQAGHCYKSQGL